MKTSQSHREIPENSNNTVSRININEAPQDFVVVDGSTFRVNRSPRANPQKSYVDANELSTSSTLSHVNFLQRALDEARKTLESQTLEISRQKMHITKLESIIRDHTDICPEQFREIDYSAEVTRQRSSSTTSTGSGSGPGSKGLPSRKRLELQRASSRDSETVIEQQCIFHLLIF